MKLFSFRMRAISVFILDSGTSTRRCFDPHALRIRVNMSAIGSVIDIELLTPLLSYPRGTCRNQKRTIAVCVLRPARQERPDGARTQGAERRAQDQITNLPFG